jgi:acyl-CoA thioesterase YciA
MDKVASLPSLPTGEPAIRVIAMPADTNPSGDIFGGWLIWQMDLAAGNAAARHSAGRAVTVAIDAISLHAPVMVGDEVSVYAEVLRTGRSSMKIAVEAWRRPRESGAREQVTQAVFTFVAVTPDCRPRQVTLADAGS